MTKIVYIATNCPHYRVKTYELLAQQLPHLKFYFFSQGDEWYWMPELAVQSGDFDHEYLRSLRVGRWYIAPSMLSKLWGYDVYISSINGRFSFPFTYLMARLRGKPFILWTGVWHRIQTPFQRAFFPFLKYIYRHADAIVTYGTHIEQYLISEGVQPERIFASKHATENTLYSREIAPDTLAMLREQWQIPADHQVVLYVGRLVADKGLDYLLDAFIRLEQSDTTLVLVGTGGYADALKMRATEQGVIERMRFIGYIPPQDLAPYYALADVFVLPSITTPQFKEPWGLVINEAFNQGVPVIATDAVGAAAGGLVQHEVNGYIVSERDSEALRQHLQLLLDDDERRLRFGQAARQIVLDWNNAAMVNTFLSAIEFVQR